jgi:hypothetical protein
MVRFFPLTVSHCGRRILNKHRNREAQFTDWQRVASILKGAPPT